MNTRGQFFMIFATPYVIRIITRLQQNTETWLDNNKTGADTVGTIRGCVSLGICSGTKIARGAFNQILFFHKFAQ